MKGNKKRITGDNHPCYVWLERYLCQSNKITKRMLRKGRATFGMQNEMAWVFQCEREVEMVSEATLPDCGSAEFGTYSGQLQITTPSGKLAGIDACILDEILDLWGMGVTTIESCCGHNKTSSYIAVAEKDVENMHNMGYKVDSSHPSGCVFHSKTSRHAKEVAQSCIPIWDAVKELTKGVEVDLDAPLEDE